MALLHCSLIENKANKFIEDTGADEGNDKDAEDGKIYRARFFIKVVSLYKICIFAHKLNAIAFLKVISKLTVYFDMSDVGIGVVYCVRIA